MSKAFENVEFLRNTSKYAVVAGVLRNVSGTWSFLNDSGHVSVNVDSVSVSGNEVIINYSSISASKVVSFVIAPDERFARDAIIGGASVGLTEARIRIGAPLNFWINIDTQTVTTSPWWDGDISVSIASDYLEITHPSVDQSIFLEATRIGSSTNPQIEVGQTRESTTRTRIYPKTTLYGYLSYDGSNWSKAFVNPEFQNAISTSFATGELTVSHPSAAGDNDLILTGRQPYAALADAYGSTSFQVQFWDFATGAQITTENTSMRFFFSRKNVKNINSGVIDIPVGNWSFKAPTAWIADPRKLTTPLSNFFIFAVFEKS